MVSPSADVKDLVIAGCPVHLSFQSFDGGQWSVQGTVQCGLVHADRSFATGLYDSREAAEQEALRMATGLLGNNVDRNTSRVKNWS